MKNYYPHEKFTGAVRGMAVSPKSLQERIADAYIYHIMHVKTEEVPDDVKFKFEGIRERLTSVEPVGGEGSVMASVRDMSDNEAMEIANGIVDIYDHIESEFRE